MPGCVAVTLVSRGLGSHGRAVSREGESISGGKARLEGWRREGAGARVRGSPGREVGVGEVVKAAKTLALFPSLRILLLRKPTSLLEVDALLAGKIGQHCPYVVILGIASKASSQCPNQET